MGYFDIFSITKINNFRDLSDISAEKEALNVTQWIADGGSFKFDAPASRQEPSSTPEAEDQLPPQAAPWRQMQKGGDRGRGDTDNGATSSGGSGIDRVLRASSSTRGQAPRITRPSNGKNSLRDRMSNVLQSDRNEGWDQD